MKPPRPALEVLKDGLTRGIPVENFGPVWDGARLRLSRASWQAASLAPFLNFDVPYTGTSSGRLSQDAVAVALAARPDATGLRVLELGSGSGVFAKLFLDELQRLAPEVYENSSYLLTDGSAGILAAQSARGIFAPHSGRVEQRRMDLSADWPDPGQFDVILGTYILDSLPFDLLAINDDRVWRREVRAVLESDQQADAAALVAALAAQDPAALHDHLALGPQLYHQTRHVPVTRDNLPQADSLPETTEGITLPYIHTHGAITCLRRACAQLAPGGVLIFSDYGHTVPYGPLETPEFQTYGLSVAVGVNFPQVARAFDAAPGLTFYAPEEEDGHLFTRVIQAAAHPDAAAAPDLSEIVSDLYGALRHRAFSAPIEAARELGRGRMFDAMRGMYAKALDRQPRNWALMQEIVHALMLPNGEFAQAVEMAELGLTLNPISPDLWRGKAEALVGLGRPDEARAAIEMAVDLAPQSVSALLVLARLALERGDPAAALRAVADGFSHDREADMRDALTAVQDQAIMLIARQQLRLLRATADPFRMLDALPQA